MGFIAGMWEYETWDNHWHVGVLPSWERDSKAVYLDGFCLCGMDHMHA